MLGHHSRPNEDEIFTLPFQEITIDDFPSGEGWILDIGAGGEGIIELVKGRQVIAIDKRKDELEETRNDALKIVMDAKDLKFLDQTFETVTSFFTLMYVTWEDVDQVLDEVARVLKPRGTFLVWDTICNAPEGIDKKYFMIPMKVHIPDGSEIHTGYGARFRCQNVVDFVSRFESRFKVIELQEYESYFFARLEKLG